MITDRIKRLGKKKAEQYRLTKKSGLERDWAKVRDLSDRLYEEIRKAKERYEESIAKMIRETNRTVEKPRWKLTKRYYAKSKNTRQLNPPSDSKQKTNTEKQ